MARRRAAAAVRIRQQAHEVSTRSPPRSHGRISRLASNRGSTSNTLMLRGIFMPAGVSQEQVDFYIDLLKKVRETPEWKEFKEKAAFNEAFMTRQQFAKWVKDAEAKHKSLMQKPGSSRRSDRGNRIGSRVHGRPRRRPLRETAVGDAPGPERGDSNVDESSASGNDGRSVASDADWSESACVWSRSAAV